MAQFAEPASAHDDTHAAATGKRLRKLVAVTALPAVLTLIFLSLTPSIAGGDILRWAMPWFPGLGVSLSLYVDGLGLLFALLISGIGVVVFSYASVYMEHYAFNTRFFIVLTLFMLSMLGVVLSDNIITLFVFWELTTITSYLLIGFTHDEAKSRYSALQALLVTGLGGLAMLAGLILLGLIGGSFELSDLRAGTVDIREHGLYGAILALVLIGCFTKSAQFPFHFWLPNAMAAPTPVSAYLHSATMVKAGIYLMARLHPTLGGTDGWVWALTLAGGITAVMSSVWSLYQRDLKQVLAWTTIMGLGTLTLMLGGGDKYAVMGAMTFLVVHCLYKATLFLAVGAIDHATHTRDRDELSGLRRAMPKVFALSVAAALSMAGLPPFIGFIGKEVMYEGALHAATLPALVAGFALAANAMMIGAAGIVAVAPFIGPERSWPAPPHDPPLAMWLGPAVLGTLGLLMGLLPFWLADPLIGPATSAVYGSPVSVHLALWHGINLPLLLSLATFALGYACWHFRAPIRAALERTAARVPLTAEQGYDHALAGVKAFAAWQTRVLQHGSLRGYLGTIFATIVILTGWSLVRGNVLPMQTNLLDATGFAWAAALLIVAGTATAIVANSRLTAICALGAVGVGTAMLFAVHGAVDVALTQVLIDILFVILLAIALLELPPLDRFRPRLSLANGFAAVVSLAIGALMTVILISITSLPLDTRITEYYEAMSVPAAHGRNIVNVILVDFRALDTLGEIAVIALAGLAAYALISLRQKTLTARRDDDGSVQ